MILPVHNHRSSLVGGNSSYFGKCLIDGSGDPVSVEGPGLSVSHDADGVYTFSFSSSLGPVFAARPVLNVPGDAFSVEWTISTTSELIGVTIITTNIGTGLPADLLEDSQVVMEVIVGKSSSY